MKMPVLVTAKWKSGLSQIGKRKGPDYLKFSQIKSNLWNRELEGAGMHSLIGSRRKSGLPSWGTVLWTETRLHLFAMLCYRNNPISFYGKYLHICIIIFTFNFLVDEWTYVILPLTVFLADFQNVHTEGMWVTLLFKKSGLVLLSN